VNHHGIHLTKRFVHDGYHDDLSMFLIGSHSLSHSPALCIVLRGRNRAHIQCSTNLCASHSTDVASRFNTDPRLFDRRRRAHIGNQLPGIGETMEVSDSRRHSDGRGPAHARERRDDLYGARHDLLRQALQVLLVVVDGFLEMGDLMMEAKQTVRAEVLGLAEGVKHVLQTSHRVLQIVRQSLQLLHFHDLAQGRLPGIRVLLGAKAGNGEGVGLVALAATHVGFHEALDADGCKTRRKRPLGAGQSDRSAMVIRSLRNSS